VEPDSTAAAPAQDVDAALQAWRQGDCVLGEQWFLHRFLPSDPITDASHTTPVSRGGDPTDVIDVAETPVAGLVVVTQTCDIVRPCSDRPFIDVCPLVEVNADDLAAIAQLRRPIYALVPALADRRLVAHLDRLMTLEKPVVAQWARVAGCRDDAELRAFAEALSRKFARFAFPDDFDAHVKRLVERLDEKHRRNSDEGRALRALREIRVRATPAWDAPEVGLHFWFIRYDAEATFENRPWSDQLAKWLTLVPAASRFAAAEGVVVALDDLTAADYLQSDRLDLDRLTRRATRTP